ncbi:type VI secretion system protein TssA [Acidicapsa acidisoli]|uniref:type VI secretion system protein TssA n=1 Tax=Acidicapsa acidisoli TaxID=1615681 RepID=UPI0021DF9F6F|nr:type VI secretion system protein TssA [Acidicapsa acidisoli]
MPLREDILAPIPGENPSGIDLRYDNKLLIHDKIKEARRQDDDLSQGDWQSERKTANFPFVVKLGQDTLATVSKDLQVAAWLTEALLQTERFEGLRQGLELTHKLMIEFWETVYPIIEDGDRELRAVPLAWIGSKLDFPLRSTPICGAGYSWFVYKESRVVGYEDQAKTDKDKKTRSTMLANGKIAPEVFDKAFAETPKAFYLKAEKDLDACIEALANLDKYCDEMFEDDAPAFGTLKTGLTEVRHTIHQLLEKKREKEPDPVEVESVAEVALEDTPAEEGDAAAAASTRGFAGSFVAEPADRRQAVASIAGAAAFLRKREPFSPAPYLLLRALRWGELRTATRLGESNLLEAPPTELRQQIKRLALNKKWSELLEAGEQAMALPGSRAWLDLQRLSVAACTALGADYQPIATAIQSELRALLNDLPELLDVTLMDDTPAANQETKAWLRGLQTPTPLPPSEEDAAPEEAPAETNGTPTWLAPSVDAYMLAKDALAAGQEEKAFAIMRAEVGRQRSGRRRFRRTMQMIELAIAAGKDGIAQPLLEDIAATIETHKLDAWEDPDQVASDLLKLMRYSKKIQGSSSDKQKLFERICRLDPVQALNAG